MNEKREKGVTTCGLWGCGKPANGERIWVELNDGLQKSIRLCEFHTIMVKGAASSAGETGDG